MTLETFSGSVTSITSMSFEKRDNIRPVGVIEKKNIGALKIFASREMCKTTAA